jgi:hypothetical protein
MTNVEYWRNDEAKFPANHANERENIPEKERSFALIFPPRNQRFDFVERLWDRIRYRVPNHISVHSMISMNE